MLSGISIWQLLILLAIVILVFGSKRLRNLGPDLGSALKGFRSAMKDDDKDKEEADDPKVVDHVQQREDASQAHGAAKTKAGEDDSARHRD